MIKKIDANKYGVVRYAITSVDELNRLPKKIAPSSQAILIENGLRVFVYGDRQWVEEVVDGDLSENMRSIVADYERSKIGYDGVKRGSLQERLKDDFQGIYDILNARDYCEYRGRELKVDNTWMGNQIDTRIEGRTLQNLCDSDLFFNKEKWYGLTDDYHELSNGYLTLRASGNYVNGYARNNGMFKLNTKYTLVFDVKENTLNTSFTINSGYQPSQPPIAEEVLKLDIGKTGILKFVFTVTNIESTLILKSYVTNTSTSGHITFRYAIFEGDHTQTPLSELPYFEGIESVGEREIGKNLLDPSELEYGSIEDGAEANKEGYITNRKRSGFMKVKPNTNYVFSSNLDEIDVNWWLYDINKKYISNGGYCQTITTPSNCEYIRIHNGHTDGTPLSDFKLQVEEGTVATEYEPFGYIIKGKSCGKNLCIGEGDFYGYYDDTTETYNAKNNKQPLSFNLKPNTTYTRIMYDCEFEGGCIYMFDSVNEADGTYKQYPYWLRGTTCVTTFTTGEKGGVNEYVINPEQGTAWTPGFSLKIGNLVILEGDHTQTPLEELPYEPYQESTYSIHSPIPLRSLPNGVCDVYDFESGAVIQKVGKIVLDGTQERINRSPNSDSKINTSYFNFSDYELVEGSSILCDKLIQKQSGGLSIIDDIECIKENRILWINIYKTNADTVEELRAYLSRNPITVYYQLKEPIIHYLTPSQLKSFDGVTHVISENTLIPTTTTKILTDTYANVSNVNSTAYSLRRGVNNVAETSDIINETDVEQDDVLDVTMCAIDELYSMLEPNLE